MLASSIAVLAGESIGIGIVRLEKQRATRRVFFNSIAMEFSG